MAFWDDMSGNLQPAFDQYAQAMRQQAAAYQPWVNYGGQGLGQAFNQYQQLISDPNFVQNMVTKGFYTSPYQQEMLKRTQERMNINAANTGMLGSGAANRALQDELAAMTGQYMNEYINRGMGSYGQGLAGMGDVSRMGLEGLAGQTPLYEQAAGAELKGEMSRQGARQGLWGGLAGLGAGIAGLSMPGGGSFGGMLLNKGLNLFRNPKSSTIELGY